MGLALGLLGGGGSVLTVPIFVYVLGVEAKAAIASSLAVVGATSLVGALRHRRAGHLRTRVAVTFGAVAMVGAYVGARLGVLVDPTLQLLLFASVMLVAAAFMLRPARVPVVSGAGEVAAPAGRKPLPAVAAAALGVGALTGLVGVGGGFLIVPALVLLLDLPMKDAVGTSLLVIFLNAAAGFAGYVGEVPLPWPLMALFGACSVTGIFLGVLAVGYVPDTHLRKGFAVFLVAVALLMLFENRAVLLAAF